ncbi:hypothetical protein CW735_10875 [Alteromonas sp. MB-3u-76]|nr:hypothetical protein CW735_10875 [Alteromonas sp. MB-3u-76]
MIWFNILYFYCCFFTLFPVISFQALWVRKKALRLPEPVGAREILTEVEVESEKQEAEQEAVQEAIQKPIKILLTGDSAAAGVGVETQNDALLGKLQQQLLSEDNTAASICLLAKAGLASQGLLELLQKENPRRFDIAVVSIGVNDVTRFTSLKAWNTNVSLIYQLLVQKFGCKLVIFSGLPPMAEFPAIPQPLRYVLGLRAAMLNNALEKSLITLPFGRLLTVNLLNNNFHTYSHSVKRKPLLNANMMAIDGFHPSSAGYAIWAKQIVTLIKENNTPW